MFLRKSDVVKIACLAPIVNVISPLLTTRDSLLKYTTYYPPPLFSKLAARVALDVKVKSPTYETPKFGELPLLDVSSSFDEATSTQAVFIVNRSQTASLPVELHWQDRTARTINAAYQLAGTDPKAFNSFEDPNQVVTTQIAPPRLDGQSAMLELPPLSFTALEISL